MLPYAIAERRRPFEAMTTFLSRGPSHEEDAINTTGIAMGEVYALA